MEVRTGQPSLAWIVHTGNKMAWNGGMYPKMRWPALLRIPASRRPFKHPQAYNIPVCGHGQMALDCTCLRQSSECISMNCSF